MIDTTETNRPARLNILALLILAVAVINGLRLGEAIFFWNSLREYGAFPMYISISGGVWLIIGGILSWGIWFGKAWARLAIIGGTIAYTAWYWVDRLVLQVPHANWPFGLVSNIILMGIVFSIIFSRRTRSYFKKDIYER